MRNEFILFNLGLVIGQFSTTLASIIMIGECIYIIKPDIFSLENVHKIESYVSSKK